MGTEHERIQTWTKPETREMVKTYPRMVVWKKHDCK